MKSNNYIMDHIQISSGDIMLFVAEHMHPASQCPMGTQCGKDMIKNLFSEEHVKSAGIEIKGRT